MGITKIKDIVVKTGSYVDAKGETRGNFEPVGELMQGDDGNQFILLKRTFNPAGVNVEAGKQKVLLSLYDPKPRDGQGGQQGGNGGQYQGGNAGGYGNQSQGQGQAGGAPAGGPRGDMDDEIPFGMEWRL